MSVRATFPFAPAGAAVGRALHALGLCLAHIVFLLGITAANAEIPPAPIGLDVDGRFFALVSNLSTQWKVRSNDGPFEAPKLAVLLRKAVPGGTGAFDRQPYGAIWARTCTTAKQTVTFRRSYFLLGPPKTLAVELHDTTFGARPANSAIVDAKIYINGQLAFSAPGAYISLPQASRPRQAKLFKFGNNVIDVVVVKRATNGSLGRCQNNFNPPQPLGVLLDIHGEYEADLWLSNNNGVDEEFWKRVSVDENLEVPFVVGGRPENHGPSGIYKGRFAATIQGGSSMLVEKIASVTGTGLRNCVVTQVGASGTVECEIYRMPPGASARVTFRAVPQFNYRFDVATVFSRAEASSYSATDPNSANNGWRRYHRFCGISSTNPKCP